VNDRTPTPRLLTILIVEDNYIIAHDLADQLGDRDGAADVTIMTKLPDALNELPGTSFDIAFLEFDLAGTSTIALADALVEAGVRLIFTSGITHHTDIPERHRRWTIVHKPYDFELITLAVSQTLQKSE
jgi:CheY-like chemotaxis protein